MATLTETQKLQGEINKQLQWSSDPTSLFLMSMKFNSLEGIVFKDNLRQLFIGGENNAITSLENVNFPPNVKVLRIHDSPIRSLQNITFPERLEELSVIRSQLTTLEGVRFPPHITTLNFNENRITSLKGVTFPNTVFHLYLDDNQIASFDGMKFPLSLSVLSIKNNPLNENIQTIRLIKNPSETVIRDIVRAYPQTAEYFEQQKESEIHNMRKLQNHIRSIAQFLQPLIAERKTKEEAKLTKGKPRLFVVNASNNNTYTIPFIASQTVQTAIDYLEQNYLLSVTNSYVKIKLTKRSDNTVLDPLRTFADYSIQNEDTLNVVQDNSSDAVRVSRGGKHQHKTKRKPSRSSRR